MKAYHHLIRGPIITEKTHSLREANNKLTLKVDVKANKIEIRKAIETLFKVKVLAVNTIQMMGKKKKLGKSEGKRPDWKKAIVTLAPGEKIAGYEGL
ncbi:MAG: 50S ribosomal protein L23 [Desulfobaccales bacterium]